MFLQVGDNLEPGRLCRLARQARGLTLAQVAPRLGRSHAWLSMAERGVIRLSADQVTQLLRIVGVRLEKSIVEEKPGG